GGSGTGCRATGSAVSCTRRSGTAAGVSRRRSQDEETDSGYTCRSVAGRSGLGYNTRPPDHTDECRDMAKSKAKSGASARAAKPAKKPAAASKSKSAKRIVPIKKSSKPAKKAAPLKQVKKSAAKAKPQAKAAAKHAPARKAAKPAPAKKVAPPKKAAPAKKPLAKPELVAKSVAHNPEPVKTAVAHPKPAPKHERGAVAVAKPGSEPTVTKEDGRYALPATVNIDLPKGYRPSQKEEYMGPKQLAYFRNKLRDWRDQLVEESRQTMENLREEV